MNLDIYGLQAQSLTYSKCPLNVILEKPEPYSASQLWKELNFWNESEKSMQSHCKYSFVVFISPNWTYKKGREEDQPTRKWKTVVPIVDVLLQSDNFLAQLILERKKSEHVLMFTA